MATPGQVTGWVGLDVGKEEHFAEVGDDTGNNPLTGSAPRATPLWPKLSLNSLRAWPIKESLRHLWFYERRAGGEALPALVLLGSPQPPAAGDRRR